MRTSRDLYKGDFQLLFLFSLFGAKSILNEQMQYSQHIYDQLEREQLKVEQQTQSYEGAFVRSEEAIKYYESVKKIMGATDVGPYFQAIGVFSDGRPVPGAFEEFEDVKEDDGVDLKEEGDAATAQPSRFSRMEGSKVASAKESQISREN